MTFKTLEQRFQESATGIYNRFSGENTATEIKPNSPQSRNNLAGESRALPVFSTIRDAVRVGSFLLSPKGALFLGKQSALQTGNTFTETRRYNLLSVPTNVVPFLHTKRHIVKSDATTRPVGLQKESSDNHPTLKRLSDTISSLDTLLKYPGYSERPEDRRIPSLVSDGKKLKLNTTPYLSETHKTEDIQIPKDVAISQKTQERSRGLQKLSDSNGYFQYKIPDSAPSAIDSYNGTPEIYGTYVDEIKYDSIDGLKKDNPDIVKFAFTTVEGNPVQFRAFISKIRQTMATEFNDQKYLGRIERFVTYAGVKRMVNLEFNIVAFSSTELKNMWLRINYLTGLAFPKGISDSGFLTPPLFKITVGKIYDNQPCYVNNIDFDFLDESTTFDTDDQVSQTINVTMQITLLEKTSKVYDSPFYRITEELQGKQLRPAPMRDIPAATAIPTPAIIPPVASTQEVGRRPLYLPRHPAFVPESTRVTGPAQRARQTPLFDVAKFQGTF